MVIDENDFVANRCVIYKEALPLNYMFLACRECAKKVDYDYYADNANYEAKQKK